ncbi:MAG: 50S ribosomal protein L24 [Candidatus Aenigmatarchaeota archaeon]
MKKKFSRYWKSSKQPRKQRKYRYNAPLHIRQKMVSAHLDKELRKEYKKRSIPIRKGDEILIMRGEFKGRKGIVTKVDLNKMKIYVDNVKRKKVSGQETEIPLDPSNVKIIKLNLDDKKRLKFLKRKNKVI